MKGMDLFCGSPASTAICSSMVDHRSMVHRSHSSKDRHHHRRKNYDQLPHFPCSSHLPINPRPHNNYEKSRNGYSKQSNQLRRKSSADILDLNSTTTTVIPDPGSSRYLLSDSPLVDWFSESDHHHVPPLVPAQPASLKYRTLSSNDSCALKSSASTRSRHQVVVLRVSLHCKGCEGKLRKHLSKMEGVTSFSIDLATKKVTVIGDVTPLGVLASVSKVKNAQLWPSPTSSSSSTSSSPWSA
ncbi:hypothetical protein FNV43_RR04249 [Rhamnella rubrinervis]|uniref:HMA domain-containing protein n=1 Tax=Rhamnella rubrinervis TaxID=2594499 RepID=A0A8K0HLJ0_9ROSA|nr:hypothetical protein FNV43_RR04249 [Rhamnella rubrinervis]